MNFKKRMGKGSIKMIISNAEMCFIIEIVLQKRKKEIIIFYISHSKMIIAYIWWLLKCLEKFLNIQVQLLLKMFIICLISKKDLISWIHFISHSTLSLTVIKPFFSIK